MDSTSDLPNDIRFLCQWTHDFDKLLADKLAIKLFAQFLKKEYSYENLKFWLSCKKYKRISDQQQRIEYAKHVYDKYLKPGAEQAVNVDNKAVIAVQTQLEEPTRNLFDIPERQIYELMKTDCYKRFLKSFYSNGMNESVFHEKISQRIPENQSFSERYRKNAYRKLRRHELQQINRRIAKRRLVRNHLSPIKATITATKAESVCTPIKSQSIKGERMQRSTQMASLQWIQSTLSASKPKKETIEAKRTSVIIVFPNGSQEKVELNRSETLQVLLRRVLKRRNLNYTSFDAYSIGSDKPLDLNTDVLNLSCGRIRIEQRVLFEVQLPNGLNVTVRSKPTTISAQVLNPVLIEFNRKYDPEYYEIRFTETWDRLAPDMPIFCADNRKLVVLYEGTNESKSLINNKISDADREKIFLKEFLGKQIDLIEAQTEHKDFNICDMSFNDDIKSEEFFNDLMKHSQSVPKDTKELSNSAKINTKSHKNNPNKENFLENILFLSEKSSEKPKKFVSKIKINSPKLKIIDFKKKSPPILKSDQLYDKRTVRRNDKTIEEIRTEIFNRNMSSNKSVNNSGGNAIKTLSKFHKTSREKLKQCEQAINTKVNVPDLFDIGFN